MSIFQRFFDRIVPVVKADEGEEEELVDPQKVLRESCGQQKKCIELQNVLNTCNDRVNSRKNTEEICFEELIDYIHCVDHCVAKTLFSKLK